MKKEKNAYITPLLTVVEFKAERGYSASDPIQEWTGWSIQQEVMMINEMGERVSSEAGDLDASYFGDAGNISWGANDWGDGVTPTGGWF